MPADSQAAKALLAAQRERERARPVDVLLRDPLGDVARKERRSLLGISAIAILVGKTGLVPEKIENFGIAFTAPERTALLWVFMAVVAYYMVAFVLYALSDFLSYRHAVYLGIQELRRQRSEDKGVMGNLLAANNPEGPKPWRMIHLVAPVSLSRGIFDFVVPLLIAGYAIWALWGATHTTIQARPTAPSIPATLQK